MCGIVGAVAQRNITPILVEGLKRLEYRGYDSCGVALHVDGKLERSRSTSRVAELEKQIDNAHLSGFTGIAHTRWATHGAPASHNAHPHFSRDRIALVHNGIIENHDELREELKASGYVFESQTDTEVIAHLVDHLYTGDLFETVQIATKRLTGAFAIAVFSRDEPHRVVGARRGSPLIVGVGNGENFLASDALALAGTTDQIIYLEEGDVVDLQLQRVWIVDANGKQVQREVRTVHAHTGAVELGPYRHYMQKEIFEQPRAIADTLEGVEAIMPEIFGDKAFGIFKKIDSVLILACGTSYYSGMTAKYWIEAIAGVPCNVEIASEYRYRDSVPNPNALVVTISQSGETADTLAALRHAQSQGMNNTLTICNVSTSAMVRECALAYITRAGVEVGVASTKAFTTQLAALFLLTLTLAQVKGRLSDEQEAAFLKQMRHLPVAITAVLALEPQIIAWAEAFARKENALFLGRGLHYPIALEGALKLKEISYIHAEAYPAGELKHGPLALVTEEMPVVTVAPNDPMIEKLKSNMQEVRARGGELYVFADGDSRIASDDGLHVIRLPEHYGLLSPILHVVPLQLLAYHTALARGTDVDKPRNLAKSVTVE
ncbi:MAG TPA: glutamine--fructose-6-phosphate transaminase (isomerizing) [Oxalicibacterium sp.]|uniref:glutamine--fructose-6-phosphate transaminase (isomerizing) n=1 Tax=Oxalicibacterium sp. TaxID=2766525 RepID=UPI002CF405AE|nr:glutamine--fructose-6-phosphate transaminase (isomerizing) [Oxalicibacterium sp.]HWU97289.1 glutamine--fructose-6-phosphate transaminase (isomerizing) [Oxalicibacterium sp.]